MTRETSQRLEIHYSLFAIRYSLLARKG